MKQALIIAVVLIGFQIACSNQAEQTTQENDPRVCVIDLLKLHGLLHKSPEERSSNEVYETVAPEKLQPLFSDFDQHDPFLRDLFVGFVVGALATHQGRLYVEKSGNAAEVHAGTLKVVLKKTSDLWRISIDDTIPAEIKEKALMEKQRFDDAKRTAS